MMLGNLLQYLGSSHDKATAKVNCLQQSELCDTGLPIIGASSELLQTVLQIVFGIIAVLAVIAITVAGLKFIFESNNPQETARARSTIFFAVIGLLIAISGQILVLFILGRLS